MKGIGVSKAFKMIAQANGDIKLAVQTMQKNKRLNVPEGYMESFDRAFLTFQYQVVYCPIENKLKYLRDPKDSLHSESLEEQESLDFLGEIYDEDISKRVVTGDIDPMSHEEITLDDKVKSAIETTVTILEKKKREKKSSTKRRRYNESEAPIKNYTIRKFFNSDANTKSSK